MKNYQHLLAVGVPPLAVGLGHVPQDESVLPAVLIQDEWQVASHRLGACVGE